MLEAVYGKNDSHLLKHENVLLCETAIRYSWEGTVCFYELRYVWRTQIRQMVVILHWLCSFGISIFIIKFEHHIAKRLLCIIMHINKSWF